MKNFKNFRTKVLAVFLVCTALLTSCGASSKNDMSMTATESADGNFKGIAQDNGYSEDYYYESDNADGFYENGYAEESADENTVHAEDVDTKKNDVSGNNIDREMLVYSCTMNVDVLDFENASEQFRTKLNQYQGFIESENLSDGGSTGRWYNEDEQKWHTYTATVRVPSRVYEDFCTAVAELGDLRNKNASVENVSQEYHDLSTTLDIYEKKEDRYLEMLANAKDEVNAVAIEDKLTSIQVEIAKLKTRMNQIKTDVAYSYVYVTISEVKEYQAEPVHQDTFGQRLGNTLKDAGSGFLNFLEGLLFLVIYMFPYLLLLGFAVFVFVKIVKTVKKVRKNRKEKKEMKTASDESQKNNDEKGAE